MDDVTVRLDDVIVRPATRADLPRITEIYNYYIINTAITFDIEPCSVEARVPWFEEHAGTSRHRLFVAENEGRIVGYAGTGRWRDKAAYDPSVETTIYCAHDATSRGIGSLMYRTLFAALEDEDIHRVLAGITLPNDASLALHRNFGFKDVGVFNENGRKFDRYWDVVWMDRPLKLAGR